LRARSVFAYAVACLEHQAVELAAAVDVALVSVEAFTGGSALRKRLGREIGRMLGESLHSMMSPDEQSAIAEVEREIARDFPFYLDEKRLDEVHEKLGMLRLGGG
jgi:hypothetical protein